MTLFIIPRHNGIRNCYLNLIEFVRTHNESWFYDSCRACFTIWPWQFRANSANFKRTSQLAITCSKLAIETLEQSMKRSKLTIKTPERRHWL